MQNYAYDKNRLISASDAIKGLNYQCPECHGTVLLRSGSIRQAHFYHPKKILTCRLAQKGLIHIQLQNHIKKLFPDAELEKQFPQIFRIADVYIDNIVFEIQYSPMSYEEAQARCKDYESLDFQIIWILHDHHYNQKRLRPAEQFLRTKICYFSNMDEKGNGVIYDQRKEVQPDLTKRKPLPKFKWPEPLLIRAKTWSHYHEGDLFDAALKGKTFPKPHKKKRNLYEALLHILLERSST